jgi:hypothetical protein
MSDEWKVATKGRRGRQQWIPLSSATSAGGSGDASRSRAAPGPGHWTSTKLAATLQAHCRGLVQLPALYKTTVCSLRDWLCASQLSRCKACASLPPQLLCLGLGSVAEGSSSANPAKQLAFLLLLRHIIALQWHSEGYNAEPGAEVYELPCASEVSCGHCASELAAGPDAMESPSPPSSSAHLRCLHCSKLRVSLGDPAFVESDHAIFASLGMETLANDRSDAASSGASSGSRSWEEAIQSCRCRDDRSAGASCPGRALLIFMPHCPSRLLSNVLWGLWQTASGEATATGDALEPRRQLSGACIIANSIQLYVRTTVDKLVPSSSATSSVSARQKNKRAEASLPAASAVDGSSLSLAAAKDPTDCIVHLALRLTVLQERTEETCAPPGEADDSSLPVRLVEQTLDPQALPSSAADESLVFTFAPALSTTSVHYCAGDSHRFASVLGHRPKKWEGDAATLHG